MEHTHRLERLVLMAIKLDFRDVGRRSKKLFIGEIQLLGRKVACPCKKRHNDMFLTTRNWNDTHMDELKGMIFEFSKLDRIESENLFKVEVDQAVEGADGEEGEQDEDGPGDEERPTPVRAKSEERAEEIHAELVKAQRTWVRGETGRLIRTT